VTATVTTNCISSSTSLSGSGPLKVALSEGWLVASEQHAHVVLSTCGGIIDELSGVGPVEKLMSSPRLAPSLACMQAVLLACSDHDPLHAPAFELACRTWALMVRVLEKGLPAYLSRPACRPAVPPLLALLRLCWYFLLQAPPGRAPAPRLLRAWLPALMRWLPALASLHQPPPPPPAPVPPPCLEVSLLVGSLELMMGTVRDMGPLGQEALAAAREVLRGAVGGGGGGGGQQQQLGAGVRARLAALFP
ncbi:hypothetical protein Agub_g12664, partial [Astrephomene gubernaculifera]